MTTNYLFIAQSLSAQAALLAIVAAGLTIYLIATRNRLRKSMNQPRAASRERYAELHQRTRLSRDLEEVMGDLDELARQINGKLDLRFAKLEAVIRDADARIDLLTRQLRQARGEATLDVTVQDEDTETKRPDARYAVSPLGRSMPDDAEMERPLHADVYELADKGLNAVDIAEKTNRTAGEIELILALRRAKNRQEDIVAKTV